TNVISELFRPSPEVRVVDWLSSLTGDVAITSVTLAELLAGVPRLPDGRRKAELTRHIGPAVEMSRSIDVDLPVKRDGGRPMMAVRVGTRWSSVSTCRTAADQAF